MNDSQLKLRIRTLFMQRYCCIETKYGNKREHNDQNKILHSEFKDYDSHIVKL